ncbi:MAG: hypothetical protein K8J09_08005 [Planctomycetes bacterium]|nr:hypothetical protein [Planctomycetota bacterium]
MRLCREAAAQAHESLLLSWCDVGMGLWGAQGGAAAGYSPVGRIVGEEGEEKEIAELARLLRRKGSGGIVGGVIHEVASYRAMPDSAVSAMLRAVRGWESSRLNAEPNWQFVLRCECAVIGSIQVWQGIRDQATALKALIRKARLEPAKGDVVLERRLLQLELLANECEVACGVAVTTLKGNGACVEGIDKERMGMLVRPLSRLSRKLGEVGDVAVKEQRVDVNGATFVGFDWEHK